MKIVCAADMPFAREAFSTLGDVTVLEGRRITREDVRDADILAIRSTTAVNRTLLEGSRVRFVGTATIGTDHMDLEYLRRAGIAWCYAPGCNANSVSEYVVAALLCLGQRHGFTLRGKTVGVIGVGSVGSRVVLKARALGMRVLKNDPPRQRADQPGAQVETPASGPHAEQRPLEPGPFVALEEVLAESDIITLHVPLIKSGPDPTFHMADERFFRKARRGSILINAARGGVVDPDALLRAMDEGTVRHAVLDTWENEPQYRRDVLDRADLGTPHIAGHSFEGKVNGTAMVYRQVCRFLNVSPAWSAEALLPPAAALEVGLDGTARSGEEVLWSLVRQAYDIEADDRRMRAGNVADPIKRGEHFDRLRRTYPKRREFPAAEVVLGSVSPDGARQIRELGFPVRGLWPEAAADQQGGAER